jgi:four helix bundle protein
MKRSAISISSNIAEGAARERKREIIRFLYIALAPLSDMEKQIIIAENLILLKRSQFFLILKCYAKYFSILLSFKSNFLLPHQPINKGTNQI